MTALLDAGEIAARLEQLRIVAPLDVCWTCECLQGYLAELQMNTTDEGAALVASLRVSRTHLHSCLGCDPCPPGDLHGGYLSRGPTAITLF